MQTKDVTTPLWKEEQETLASRGWLAIIYMGTPLVLSFCFVDYYYANEFWKELLLIRLTVIPATLIYFLLSKFTRLPIEWRLHYYALFFGVYTAILVAKTGYELSAYYAGFNLVALVSVIFLPWSPRHLFVNIVCIYSPYICALLLKPSGVYEWGPIITYSSFCISTILVCSICWYLIRQVRKKEHSSRQEVNELIKHQEQTIKEKTQESVLLHKLSRQFTDETIQLVKEGAINLDARERRHICCIFIDIEESTSKANSIDHREYLDLLDNFFNACTEIFLKHQITVGTFLGDGLLAFSNAPISIEDHELKATNACLEILEKRKKLNTYFKNTWKSEFNIRIGITAGYCYCGFFPSGTKGNYSVNGTIVNLCSRLCDAAPSNSICTTKNFLINIEPLFNDLVIKKMFLERDLKGFENSTPQLYSVAPETMTKSDQEVYGTCPLCHEDVWINDTNDNIKLIKCSNCHYNDIIEPEIDEQEKAS